MAQALLCLTAAVQLFGRGVESERISAMLHGARCAARSACLVLVGEAGIGKTALLDFAAAHCEGMLVARTGGVQAEFDLPFSAGLDRLFVPLVLAGGTDDSEGSAAVWALVAALRKPPPSPDRFAMGSDLLKAMAALAGDCGLLVLVDDTQWLDHPSVELLAFAARRLCAEGVVVIAAHRPDQDSSALAALPTLHLGGLEETAARALLTETGGPALSRAALRNLVEETAGNPLALIELPRLAGEGRLSGAIPAYEPLPASARVQDLYRSRISQLPEDCRLGLLTASLLGRCESRTLAQGLGKLGLSPEALAPAEDDGLITLRPAGPQFRHPLVASAAAALASPTERRRVHRALAEIVTGADGDKARRIWHLSASTAGPDEIIAAHVDELAEGAVAAGAFSSASYAYDHAGELSADLGARSRRLLQAARAAFHGGNGPRAEQLLTTVAAADEATRVELVIAHGELDTWRGRLRKAYGELHTAASGCAHPSDGARLLLGAIYAAGLMGHPADAIAAGTQAVAQAGDDVLLTLGDELRDRGHADHVR